LVAAPENAVSPNAQTAPAANNATNFLMFLLDLECRK
jgi:hypothetical protein